MKINTVHVFRFQFQLLRKTIKEMNKILSNNPSAQLNFTINTQQRSNDALDVQHLIVKLLPVTAGGSMGRRKYDDSITTRVMCAAAQN